jgi:ferric-dicitrate binding protein FerR (iron transport regulator)
MGNENKHIDIQILTRSIAGEVTSQEQEELKLWLADREENRKEYEKLRQTWEVIGQTRLENEIDVGHEWKYHQGILKKKPVSDRRFMRNFMRVAATIIVFFGIGVIAYYLLRGETITTEYAQTSVAELPDGTRVTLNGDSKLHYSRKFGKEKREVSLEGEAYFEVAKDSLNPFIIHVDNAAIKVLGTSFNVRAYEDTEKVEVTVTEGKVSLYDQDKTSTQVIASRGEKAEYHRANRSVRKEVNTDKNYLAWKTHILIFEDIPLKEVVQVISEVYYKDIRLRNKAIARCYLTVSFEDQDLETILNVLAMTLDLAIQKEKDVIYLSGPGCE